MRISTRALHAQHARLLSHPRGRFCFRVTPRASPHSMWNSLAPSCHFVLLCVLTAALSNPRLRCVPRPPLIALLGTWHHRSVSMFALIWSQSRTHAPLVVCLDHDPDRMDGGSLRAETPSPLNAVEKRRAVDPSFSVEPQIAACARPRALRLCYSQNPGNPNSFRGSRHAPVRGPRVCAIRKPWGHELFSFRFIVRGRDFIVRGRDFI